MKLIKEYMTPSPHSIVSTQNLQFALQKMHELNVRHLPVMEAGKLVGMLSERDIRFIESYEKTDLESLRVNDAFSNDPYTVGPDASLKEVCQEMAERKIGSAIIVEKGQLLGIFTWIDALSVISKLI